MSQAKMYPLGSEEHHNVILFGAGASVDAGIPLLNSFVDKMWEYAARGKVGDAPIEESDRNILVAAANIRRDLEPYSSRAFFDIHNLEDILSLLSFEALADGAYSARYDTLVKAVARTIELSCKFPNEARPPDIPRHYDSYWGFWNVLLDPTLRMASPALITFNYDLVLERALWAYFHRYLHDKHPPKVGSCALNYHFGISSFVVKGGFPHSYAGTPGHRAEFSFDAQADVSFPYLKLHGSLNWDKTWPAEVQKAKITPPSFPTMAVDRPLILPPVFNKMNSSAVNAVWTAALQVLRHAKNIIIVGYSLPKTDIYMQYFLKAAVGPNSNLQRIIVFDPVLFTEGEQSAAMQKRYLECFSPQFSGRINFRPSSSLRGNVGTFQAFVQTLRDNPKSILFFP
jgi:hypothetical protein